jgi:kinesin family protein C2/C3
LIQTLNKDIEATNKRHVEQLERDERKAKQMEEQLTTEVEEVNYLLLQLNKKIEEVEAAFRLKSQLWDKKRTFLRITWTINNYMSRFAFL